MTTEISVMYGSEKVKCKVHDCVDYLISNETTYNLTTLARIRISWFKSLTSREMVTSVIIVFNRAPSMKTLYCIKTDLD